MEWNDLVVEGVIDDEEEGIELLNLFKIDLNGFKLLFVIIDWIEFDLLNWFGIEECKDLICSCDGVDVVVKFDDKNDIAELELLEMVGYFFVLMRGNGIELIDFEGVDNSLEGGDLNVLRINLMIST